MSKQQRVEAPAAGTSPLDDEVIGLRLSGTDQTYELSPGPRVQVLGTSRRCDVSVPDTTGVWAAQHARLVRRGSRWTVRVLEAAADLWSNRVPVREIALVPGASFGLGPVTLVAESQRSRALHRFVARMIGFGASQRAEVDRAFDLVLRAASGDNALALCGEGNLLDVARRLHLYALGDRPFVLCNPRRGRRSANVRSAWNIDDPVAALSAAAGGTLAVHIRFLPRRFDSAFERWRASRTRVQLVVCSPTVDTLLRVTGDPLVVSPLDARARDRARILDEIEAEHAASYGDDAISLSRGDRRAILEFDGATVADLEKATHRVLALRNAANLARAAKHLGMAPVSLSRWATARGLIDR